MLVGTMLPPTTQYGGTGSTQLFPVDSVSQVICVQPALLQLLAAVPSHRTLPTVQGGAEQVHEGDVAGSHVAASEAVAGV